LEAEPEELQQVKGVGPQNYLGIKFLQGVVLRLAEQGLPQTIQMDSRNKIVFYLQNLIGAKKKEHFVMLCFNSRKNYIKTNTISTGSLSESVVHPREVFKEALETSATYIILAHNHPSGDITASPEDVAITRRLVDASKIFEIQILDHLIVTKNSYSSMINEKLI
jgi:DNA repair protein RadC